MFKKSVLLIALFGSITPLAAQDLLVMRRPVSEPILSSAPSPSPTPAPAVTYRWDQGEYSTWSTTCGSDAVRTRTVTCVDDQNAVAPSSMCLESRPPAQEGPTLNLSECGKKLINGGFEQAGGWDGFGSGLAQYSSIVKHGGARSAYLPPRGQGSPLSQVIETIPGVTYRIDYWTAKNQPVHMANYFRVAAFNASDNQKISEQTIPSHSVDRSFVSGSFQWTAVSDRTRISFLLYISGGPYDIYVDDVTLTAIP